MILMNFIKPIKQKLNEIKEFDMEITLGTYYKSTKILYNNMGLVMFSLSSGIMGTPFGRPYVHINRFNYSPQFYIKDIRAVELYVDAIPVSTFKRAFSGALLFGGVGAVAGALSSINVKPKSKLSVIVYFDSLELSSISIHCKDMGEASRVISTLANLESAVDGVRTTSENSSLSESRMSEGSSNEISNEIMRLKSLLDQGIIDEDEFKAFKNKLMKY